MSALTYKTVFFKRYWVNAPKNDKVLYPDPPPRTFAEWCNDLGFRCAGNRPSDNRLLTYDEFIFCPDVIFYKIKETSLYGHWRKYGEHGESRTAREFIDDLGMELVEPSGDELNQLNRIFEYDEFWRWSSGKVFYKEKKSGGLLKKIKQFFSNK